MGKPYLEDRGARPLPKAAPTLLLARARETEGFAAHRGLEARSRLHHSSERFHSCTFSRTALSSAGSAPLSS